MLEKTRQVEKLKREKEENDRKEREKNEKRAKEKEEKRAREKYCNPSLLVLFSRKDLYIQEQWQKQ